MNSTISLEDPRVKHLKEETLVIMSYLLIELSGKLFISHDGSTTTFIDPKTWDDYITIGSEIPLIHESYENGLVSIETALSKFETIVNQIIEYKDYFETTILTIEQ